MSIQYKFFMILAKDPLRQEEELNRFLRSVSVVNVQRDFVAQGDNSFWSVVVEYLSDHVNNGGDIIGETKKKNRVDYKEILSENDFAIFVKLRDWRKKIADEEAVPVYTIFTNEQLAQIVMNKILDKSSLQQISGIGESRVKKYSEAIIGIIRDATNEKNEEVRE